MNHIEQMRTFSLSKPWDYGPHVTDMQRVWQLYHKIDRSVATLESRMQLTQSCSNSLTGTFDYVNTQSKSVENSITQNQRTCDHQQMYNKAIKRYIP